MLKRAILIGAAFGIAAGAAAAAHWQLYLPAECRGDIPESVRFHQGMTLCPGQSATFAVELK